MAFELFEANKKLLNTMETLRESEENWRLLTEYSPDFMALLDRDATTLFINHTVPGLTEAQVIGSSFYDFTPRNINNPHGNVLNVCCKQGNLGNLRASTGTRRWYFPIC